MLDLKVLGDPVLRRPEGLVTGRAAYRRRVAVLAILAVARGRPVGRERLIGLLWPDHPSDAARHTLSEALYVMRKELGDDLFVSVGDELMLNPARVRSDVEEFERGLEEGRLEEAVEAYRGPFLDGFYVADSPDFERWVDGERERLARACAQALERLAAGAEREGRLLAAAEWWRRVAAHDPYSSRVALRLARALDAAGERGAALRAVSAHAARMRDELGVEPDAALQAFATHLRADAPSASAAPPAPSSSTPSASIASISGPSSPSSSAAPPSVGSTADPSTAGATTSGAMTGGSSASTPSSSTASTLGASASGTRTAGSSSSGRSGSAPSGSDADAREPRSGGEGRASAEPVPVVAGGADAGEGEGGFGMADAGNPPVIALSIPVTGDADGRTGTEPAPSRKRRPRRWVLAGVAVVSALLGASLLPSLHNGPAPEPWIDRYDPRRIAVLYFDDHSPDGELRYLADALTGELIDQLGEVPALDVVSRNGVRAYREGEVSFDSLVARLRVGSVVEGSVQRSGDSVRVTVQLVDTNRQTQLESRTVVRPLGDLFSLEREVGEEVSGALRRRLGQEVRVRQAAAETRSRDALELVLRAEQARDEAGRMSRRGHALDQGSARRQLARADSLLRAAQAADPSWTRPVLARGFVSLARAILAPQPERDRRLEEAAALADEALAGDRGSAEALALRGRVRWQQAVEAGDRAHASLLPGAESDLRAALRADSTLAWGWAVLSQLLRLRGRFAESDLAARSALAQDAYLEDADAILRRLYFGAMAEGDYPQARQWCEQGNAQYPADWRFVECRLTLLREDSTATPAPSRAWALAAELDRLDPPARAREEGRPYSPLYRRASVAAVLARAGERDSARAMMARARAEVAGSEELRIPFLYDDAYLALLLGDREGARRLLEAYLAARPALRPYVSRDAPFRSLFAPLEWKSGTAPSRTWSRVRA